MKLHTIQLTHIAIMTAIIIVLGFIPPIPIGIIPVPIVLQNLGVMLAAIVLGTKQGTFSVGLFLLMVLLGMPFLTGQTGGISSFCSPSGGYLIAWLFVPLLTGITLSHFKNHQTFFVTFLITWIFGVAFVDAFGAFFLAWFTHISIKSALVAGLAFIPGDTLKAILATWIGLRVHKHLTLVNQN